jgi:hypothetical protein
MVEHRSDCAMHNGPALPPKPCDCGADPGAFVRYHVALTPLDDFIIYQGEFFIADCGESEEAKARAKLIARLLNEHAERAASNDRPIAEYDDGLRVYLDSYAGGAAPEGNFGTLTLRFVTADGTETRRLYRAEAETLPTVKAGRVQSEVGHG